MARRILALAAALALAVGCGAAPSEPVGATDPARTSAGATGAPGAPGATSPAAATGDSGQALPAFMSVPLTDVRSGERFTLGDFAGKVVIVQAMAVW